MVDLIGLPISRLAVTAELTKISHLNSVQRKVSNPFCLIATAASEMSFAHCVKLELDPPIHELAFIKTCPHF